MKTSRDASTRLLAVLALTLAFSGVARAGDGSVGCWALRGVVARMDTDNRLFLDLGGERRASFLNAGTGLGLSYEYRRGCRWGFEVGLLTAELNSLFIFDSVEPAFWGEARDDVAFSALTLGPTFHLTPGKRADLYVGPLLALPDFSTGDYRPVNTLDMGPAGLVFRQEFDADLAWGFQVGLDMPLRRGSPWAFNLGAKYLALEVDTGPALAGTMDVDPTIWTAGISYSPSGCRDCEDPCTRLRRSLLESDCPICLDDQECRPEPDCDDFSGLDCPVDCDKSCTVDCDDSCPVDCEESCPTCPDGQECRGDEIDCREVIETCWDWCPDKTVTCKDCQGLGCPPDCPPGQYCHGRCPEVCPTGYECREPPTCDLLGELGCPPCEEGQECREPPTCAEFLAIPCYGCAEGQLCQEPCPEIPPIKPWHLCCLILIGLVALWLIWWVFRCRRLRMAWFWLWCVPLVFLICKLWFFKSALEQVWLLWWLLIALVLLLLFVVLRLLDLKRWIRLLLAGLLILVLLALGQLAAWSWLWWFVLAALVLLLVGLIWRSAHDDPHGLVRLILLAVLILVLILLGPLAAWVWSWQLLLIVLVLLLLHWMARWMRRREPGGPIDWWIPIIVLLVVVVYAGSQAAWLWWFLAILAVLALIYVLRRWIGERKNSWLVLLAVLIVILILLGKMAAWNWLWWFLLIGLVLLLLCLLWRRFGGREGPEPPGVWLILIVVMNLVLLLLGSAAGHGWLWWFLLFVLLLALLWLLWRLLGGSVRAAWAVLGLPLVLILVFLGKMATWTWLWWLLIAGLVLLLLYLLVRYLGWAEEPEDRLRLWLCLLVLLVLTLVCLGHLAAWSGHWWIVLLALALALAGAAWRLIGGTAAGLGQLVWLGLLLIAIVLLIQLGASAGSSWLWAVLLCTLLATLPVAIWALWFHTAGGPSPIGVACAGGLVPLRKLQEGLGPIGKADPAEVRDLFLAYRDRRGWSDMYALFEEMPDELTEDLEVRQQLAFAMNRDGRGKEAEEILTALESEAERSAETWGLLGRIYKDRWDAARKLAAAAAEAGGDLADTAEGLLDKAIRAYLAGHEAGDGGNPYPGINALTLAEFDDGWRRELRDRLPDELDAALEAAATADDSDYWHHATRLELAIHLGAEGEARQALARALEAVKPNPAACPQIWKVETTCRNLRLIEEGRGQRGEELPTWASEAIASLGEGA